MLHIIITLFYCMKHDGHTERRFTHEQENRGQINQPQNHSDSSEEDKSPFVGISRHCSVFAPLCFINAPFPPRSVSVPLPFPNLRFISLPLSLWSIPFHSVSPTLRRPRLFVSPTFYNVFPPLNLDSSPRTAFFHVALLHLYRPLNSAPPSCPSTSSPLPLVLVDFDPA